MPAKFVALSDLHFGYELSVLNDPVSQERVIGALDDLCEGSCERLVLNGDWLEGCVPSDAGTMDVMGFSPDVVRTARPFFEKLAARMSIGELVLGWGNHDYTIWKRLAMSCGVSTYTNGTRGDILLSDHGVSQQGARYFLREILGSLCGEVPRIRSAYPNYILGNSWPYLVFHHGHFIDDLVIGRCNEAEYLGIRALTGQGRPAINVTDDETVRSLHVKTEAFIAALWEYNSRARELEWAIIRRGDARATCPSYPTSLTRWTDVGHKPEVFCDDLGRNVTWYANLLMADDTTPAPVGRPGEPSYLFVGHDHLGGSATIVGLDGRPWRVVDTGGWTKDGKTTEPHCHATVWHQAYDEPSVYCLRV